MLLEEIPQGINTKNLNKDPTIHMWIKMEQAANFRFPISSICKLHFFSCFCILHLLHLGYLKKRLSLLHTFYKLEVFMQQLCQREDCLKIRIAYKSDVQGGLWHHKENLFMPLPRLLIRLYLQFIHQAVCFHNKSRPGCLILFYTGLQPVNRTPAGLCSFLLTFPIATFIFIKLLFSFLFTLVFFSFLFFSYAFFLNTPICSYRSDESKQWILHSYWDWEVCKYPVIFPLVMFQSLGFVHQVALSHIVTISSLKCMIFWSSPGSVEHNFQKSWLHCQTSRISIMSTATLQKVQILMEESEHRYNSTWKEHYCWFLFVKLLQGLCGQAQAIRNYRSPDGSLNDWVITAKKSSGLCGLALQLISFSRWEVLGE